MTHIDATDQTARQLAGYDVTPQTPAIAAARRLMAAAIGYRGPQEAERLAIAEALAVLDDVVPPYPALRATMPVAATTDLTELTQLILEHLGVALDEVVEIIELTRVATAAIVLRRGGGVAA